MNFLKILQLTTTLLGIINQIQVFHGSSLSGQEKKDLVLSELTPIIQTLGKPHGKVMFDKGVSDLIDAIVVVFNATIWYESKQDITREVKKDGN